MGRTLRKEIAPSHELRAWYGHDPLRRCYATYCCGTRNEHKRATQTEKASKGEPLCNRVMKVVIKTGEGKDDRIDD